MGKMCKACVSLAFTLGACQDEDSTHMFTKIRKQVAWALTFRPSTAGSLYQLSNPMPDVAVIVLCVRVKTCIRQELAKWVDPSGEIAKMVATTTEASGAEGEI